jgi:hypothetical protein
MRLVYNHRKLLRVTTVTLEVAKLLHQWGTSMVRSSNYRSFFLEGGRCGRGVASTACERRASQRGGGDKWADRQAAPEEEKWWADGVIGHDGWSRAQAK